MDTSAYSVAKGVGVQRVEMSRFRCMGDLDITLSILVSLKSPLLTFCCIEVLQIEKEKA